MATDIKYVKDHKTGVKFYPVVKSEGIVDAFSINTSQIDMLFGEVIFYSVAENTKNVVLQPGDSTSFTIKLRTEGVVDKSDIVWTSSDTSVVTVDKFGHVEAHNEGVAVITADSQFYDIHIKIQIKVEQSTPEEQ